MINPNSYSKCSEFYVVAKTVEFVKRHGDEDRQFRIDALHDPKAGKFSTAVYVKESFTLQPTYPQTNGKFDRKPENVRLWIAYDNVGWTDRDTAEQAIEQALGFLL